MPRTKDVVFLGDSLELLREFPDGARRNAGLQLRQLQLGLEPSDWKSMRTIGPGVREIRVRVPAGAFRVVYTLKGDAVYVLHAFQKKSQATARKDLKLCEARLREV